MEELLPEELKPFIGKTEDLQAKLFKGMEFSRNTYLGFFEEGKKEVSPFIQFNREKELKDFFCTCKTSEKTGGCAHILALLEIIWQKKKKLLGDAFLASFWYALFSNFWSEEVQKEKGGAYRLFNEGGELRFKVEGKSKQGKELLKGWIDSRIKENEENSIKFSGLPSEELERWRKGRPSPEFKFELSYWSDFAKHAFIEEWRGKKHEVRVLDSKKPCRFCIECTHFVFDFCLDEEEFTALIPKLKAGKYPYPVKGNDCSTVEKVVYDSNKKQLLLKRKGGEGLLETKEGVSFGDYLYQDRIGFFLKGETKSKNLVETAEIEGFLDEQGEQIKKAMEEKLETKPKQVFFSLFFDEKWNLHVDGYLKEPGDLQKKEVVVFKTWAFSPNQGFFKLKTEPMLQALTTLPPESVEGFVSSNRGWLSEFDGFGVHVASIETELAYEVDLVQGLQFFRRPLRKQGGSRCKAFGRWIYVEGDGFYRGTQIVSSKDIFPGKIIPSKRVSEFVKRNREELTHVKGFFSKKNPISEVTLDIIKLGEGAFEVKPSLRLQKDITKSRCHFFDSIAYIEGVGFYEVPQLERLPEKYRQPVQLTPITLALFYQKDYYQLLTFLKDVEACYRKPMSFSFCLEGFSMDESFLKLDILLKTEFGEVPLKKVREEIEKGSMVAVTSAGALDLGEEAFEWLKALPKDYIDPSDSLPFKLSKLDFFKLISQFPFAIGEGLENNPEQRFQYDQFLSFSSSEAPPLKKLKCSLRKYQKTGFEWLWYLFSNHLSGLLCDDMGLGKTHQTMALMAALMAKKGRVKPKILVVCPTSVLFHWEEKLAKFLPSMPCYLHYGTRRSLANFQKKKGVLLTSYGVLRVEKEQLNKIDFDLGVFDEIQMAKNYRTQTFKTLAELHISMRLGLTGTPIENDLMELKTLFDLVLPGYFPPEEIFRTAFVGPIERGGDHDKRKILHNFIRPFILRRKKEEVLSDLPGKIEEVYHCFLSDEQSKLYRELWDSTKKNIMESLEDKKANIPYMHIFALLSKLKQVCDHPSVYHKEPKEFKKHASGKWDLCLELIEEARHSGQKVVIFSQYLHMLDILEAYLKEEGIGYATVRGSTKNRKKEIHTFNKNKDCEVFLASLGAVGHGVDLTAGSVVIHYDRWWNKAKEQQATDRVYRIGQTRGVQVFKLVTKGTIEEKIDALIEKKGKLLEDVVGATEEDAIKKLTREDLISLFEEMGKIGRN